MNFLLPEDSAGILGDMSKIIKLLVWIGFLRIMVDREYDSETQTIVDRPPRIRWPFYVCPWWIWKIHFWNVPWSKKYCPSLGSWFGVFRNSPGVIKWEKGRLLPRRWGFYIIGFEIGDRG